MEELKIISLNHRQLPLEILGKFQIEDDRREALLQQIKGKYGIDELFFLGTCNRVELLFVQSGYLCKGMSAAIFSEIGEQLDSTDWQDSLELYEGEEALNHLFRVSSSLESALVGEQEIISQLRKAHEWAFDKGLSGDTLRLVMKKAIEVAKRCYSETEVAARPISTAFLAWQRLREQCPDPNSRIVLVGAGQIISSVCQFVKKSNYSNVVVANRSLPAAQELAQVIGGTAVQLEDLKNLDGFDAIVTCTGSVTPVIDAEVFGSLVSEPKESKLVIDLALPADVAPEVMDFFTADYVSLEELQSVSEQNLELRQKEVVKCEAIIAEGRAQFADMYKQRQIELAMRDIPESIKTIRQTAVGEVFAKDLEGLDEHSKEVLQKIMDYMEKKYISLPMKLAREVMLDTVSKQ